jgi:cellulose synthase/poly-beta-1,6-N-acetylglucosamine synthase-like glycosyltransferase
LGRWTARAPTWLLRFGFVTTTAFGVVLPYGHFALSVSLGPDQYSYIRLATIVSLCVWFLGRPVLVTLTDVRRPGTALPPPNGVTVVVPCFNASGKIGSTVRCLLKQTHRPLEIVLVENNSTDDTWQVIQALAATYAEVRAFSVGEQPDVYAASVAINHGVDNATHEVILRLDDDTTIAGDAIARALAEMRSQHAVAVACNLRIANPRASIWTRLQAIEYLFAMDIDRRTQDLFGSILCCSGGMAMFRRETILQSGGFVSHPREVSEDMDMTLKSHRLGHVTIAPEAIGFTQTPERFRALLKQRFRWGISGIVSLYLHRRGLLNRSYWHTGPIGFVGLPMRAATALRDLLAPIFLLDLYLLISHDGPVWLGVILGLRIVILWLEMLLLRPALHWRDSYQGLAHWWLAPVFVLVYGPLLLAARFGGTWAGVAHVRELKRRGDLVGAEAGGGPTQRKEPIVLVPDSGVVEGPIAVSVRP